MLPERVVDLGRVWHAQAREDVQRLGTMLRFVQHDMHDPSGEPQLFVKVVGEGLLFAQNFSARCRFYRRSFVVLVRRP